MAVYDNSRYLRTYPYNRAEREDVEVFTLWKRPTFNIEEGTSYEWQEDDTLDSVAYEFYEECSLWWAILVANPEYRTEFDISAGDIIFIPDYEEVCELVNVEGGEEDFGDY